MSCACVGKDFLVVSSDEGSIQMYDRVTYKFLDHSLLTEYIVHCMCLHEENRIVMGHAGSMLSLWDTSREALN